MNNKQHHLSKLKYQLREKKRRKIKEVVWKLHEEQLTYITQSLHYTVVPYLYRVRTRTLKNYRAVSSPLLKKLHHQNKRGKQYLVTCLSEADKILLDEHGVRYWVEKYKIIL